MSLSVRTKCAVNGCRPSLPYQLKGRTINRSIAGTILIVFWFTGLTLLVAFRALPATVTSNLLSLFMRTLALALVLSAQFSYAVIDVAWWSSVAQLSTSPLLASSAVKSQCTHLQGLSPGQSQICELFADHMPAVGVGANEAIQECQYQFKSQRWNCSTPFGSGFVGPVHRLGTREAAFTYAILSAGVAHEIGRRCKRGELNSCGCSSDPKPKEIEDEYSWGGCGDNVDYGARFSNQKLTKPNCKCHGVSGACNLKTCWMQLPKIRDVGDVLQQKYKTARKVQISTRGNLQLVANDPAMANIKDNRRQQRALKTDLVYMDDSPDYCRFDRSLGTVGTVGRQCKRGSSGPEGCDALCCGRGYNTFIVETSTKCNCKFEWCCKVVCQTCVNSTRIDICK